MKKVIFSLTPSLCALCAAADVFVAPGDKVVFLAVPTNQTMLISSISLGNFQSGSGTPSSPVQGLVVQQGVTNNIVLSNAGHDPAPHAPIGPYALNGPCQIAFVNNLSPTIPAPVAVSYKLLQNSLLHSLIVTPNSTNTISIPAGKSVRFFSPTWLGVSTGFITFQDGTNTIYDAAINYGDEFSGPLTITAINPDSSGYSQLISYYFTDDFFVVPDTGCIRGPTGSFELAIEKSADLNVWAPVVVYNTASDQKAFYRLRLQK